MKGCTIMTVKEKTEKVFKHYKELNEDLLQQFEANTMFELKKQDIFKTLCYLGMHADSILIADTFIGRRFFNIVERSDAFYEFVKHLSIYDFNECKVQIFIRCDFGFQALLIAIS